MEEKEVLIYYKSIGPDIYSGLNIFPAVPNNNDKQTQQNERQLHNPKYNLVLMVFVQDIYKIVKNTLSEIAMALLCKNKSIKSDKIYLQAD